MRPRSLIPFSTIVEEQNLSKRAAGSGGTTLIVESSSVERAFRPDGVTIVVADDGRAAVGAASIATAYLADGAVTTAKLADGTVTDAKLATDVKVGSLALLATTAKTSVVAAINELEARPAGVTTFLGLSDTPSSYAGSALRALRVNAGATALEFFTPMAWGDTPTDNRSVRISSGNPVTGTLYDAGNGKIGIGAANIVSARLYITSASDEGVEVEVATVGAAYLGENTGNGCVFEGYLTSASAYAVVLASHEGSGPAMHGLAVGTGKGVVAQTNASTSTATTLHSTGNHIGKLLHVEQMNTGSTNTSDVALIHGQARGIGLRVKTTDSGNANPTLRAEQSGSGNVLELQDVSGGTPSTTANNFVVGFNGTTRNWRVTNAGVSYCNGGYISGGADFAEYRARATGYGASQFQAGTVVVLSSSEAGKIKPSNTPGDTMVMGVVSTAAAYRACESGIDEATLAAMHPIGVLGIVPCKVDNTGGAIAAGDFLVSSALEGRGAKASSTPALGSIFAMAMEPLVGSTGVITVLLMKR